MFPKALFTRAFWWEIKKARWDIEIQEEQNPV